MDEANLLNKWKLLIPPAPIAGQTDFSKPPQLKLINSHPYPQYRHVDITVEDPKTGEFIPKLSRPDFELTLGGQRLSFVTVHHHEVLSDQMAIAIVQDKSASMAGKADADATDAIKRFTNSTYGAIRFRLWRFADAIHTVTPWTTDKQLFVSLVTQEAPKGGTALYRALQTAVADLATRSERRFLLLFTDGGDSTNVETLESVIKLAVDAKVSVYAVGLRTPQLNEQALEKLAITTGGTYLIAENSSSIYECFQRISATFTKPVYRVITILPEPSTEPLQIEVGGSVLIVPNDKK